MTFNCGHPRTPENSIPSGVVRKATGERYSTCRLCNRVRRIVANVSRDMDRINKGERIFGVVGR